jgi:hypothetical protein
MGGYIIGLFQLKRLGLLLVPFIGSVLLLDSSIVGAQVVGAVQYSPPSVREDAQPPAPARMAPQSVSPGGSN